MPIITPAYPSMCATHNVTLSTKKIILKELDRGGDIVDKIFTGQLQWKNLFEKHTFFTNRYRYYLSIVSCSRSKEAQLLWSGLVESKVRHLVADLDNNEMINIAHPFIKGFDRVHRCHTQEEIDAVISGDLQYQATDIKTETTDAINDPAHNAVAQGEGDMIPMADNKDDTVSNAESITTLYTTTYYIGLELNQRKPRNTWRLTFN
jgi:poly(A) polymerase